ncbi:MAG: helix-turn-helix transcriptional regulator [Methanoregula sp.]
MPTGEHVHIISAGENIHIAYPATFRELPTITRTYVLADSTVYEISSNPATEKERIAIRNAVTAVKEVSASLSIPFSRELIFPPAYPSVRDMLTKIHREFPSARYTFDISGGSTALCTALLSFAPWLGAQVYSAFDEKTPRNVPLPERPVRSMMENPNYPAILALLLRTTKKDAIPGMHEWTSRDYIYKQLWPYYVPSRTKKAKPGDPPKPVVQYKKGRKPAAELTHGTLSTLMRTLEDAGLVEERVSEETKREKSYRITDSGEIAFRFFADPATNTLVRTALQKA